MARNLGEYTIVKQDQDLVQIDYDEAKKVKAIATSLFNQPGVHRIVSERGVEHHVAYASSFMSDGETSMGPDVQEFFMQSFVTPLYEGETTDESWHALVSFLSYDDRFAGDSSVRHVYDIDAVEGLVLAARHRILSIRNALYEGYSSTQGKSVSYAFLDHDMQKSLLETAMQSEDIERLETRVQRGLARVAQTSFRIVGTPPHYPGRIRIEKGDLPGKNTEQDPLYHHIGDMPQCEDGGGEKQ